MSITTLSEYKQVVEDSFDRWLKTHTDAQAWAEELIGDYTWNNKEHEWLIEVKGEISNSWFSVNVAEETLKLWAKDHIGYFGKCPCGMIWEIGYEDCDDCSRDEEGNEVEYDLAELDFEDFLEFEQEVFYDVETIASISGIGYYIVEALEGPAFDIYRRALSSTTAPVEEEASNVLFAISEAQSQEEMLAALAWANHVQHVNGSILIDYGGVDEWLIDQISQEGIGNILELDWENIDVLYEEVPV